ncbi:gamma-glutamyltransferase [Catellatospora sichuanensis]|uniref:gamma-glutamyltransferase n=1 Tax=Catellatospora sichuanensis TaxID=1969805 RepID=UPI003CCC5C77
MRHHRALVLIALATLASTAAAVPVQASPRPPSPEKVPVATGYGGAVATVDLDATRVGLEVLRNGGNAVDAAIAAAATLGVTEPFSAGIGGGGFLVYYSAKDKKVYTIDGREAAPMSMGETAFVDPATGLPYAFQEARVSGIAAGVPGTLATWDRALRKWGTTDLADALRPAAKVADRGFTVDTTFRTQISDNAAAFGQFSSTGELYLPGGAPPEVGSVFRNPDLADTYRLIARQGTGVFYRGAVARDIVDTVQHPPVADVPIGTWAFPIRPGTMALSDLAAYQVRTPSPTRVSYRGYDVYGMPTPSSGGQAVGEALNILEQTDLGALTRTEALHQYLEASALAFADRNRYVGDLTPRPLLDELLSDGFAKERACLVNPAQALVKPVGPGTPDGSYAGCAALAPSPAVTEGQSTTNLTVADRWGNVVEYTLTIEQTGGNGMVVPGRGFLLNNEMTDFNFTPTQGSAPDPNLPGPGKRPRSSMAPTIVLADGRPFLAVGTPGGSTIITTVLQILVNRLDLGMTLPEAVAAARATQRNTAAVLGEAGFAPEIPGLTALGHTFAASPEIGAATGIEFLGHGRLLAAAEPVRRGGGSAGVVWPVAGS